MPNSKTGSILIHIFDGSRQPLPDSIKWSARIHDGRSPSEWKIINIDANGPIELVKGLTFFDNFFDNYTLIVNAKKFEDAAWMPIHIEPSKPAAAFLMLLPKNGECSFDGADWDALTTFRPRYAEILTIGAKNATNAATRYDSLTRQKSLVAGCLLNLLTAMSQITLPSGKNTLDYYWEPIWDNSDFQMAQDRFYAYVDKTIVEDVVAAAKLGAFSEEKNPGTFHHGATLSYKQNQFDVTNVQLTFHQGNTKTATDPRTGQQVDCVVIEPDIDYFKDLVAHSLLEVLPNTFTKGLTDPRGVCLLRWTASKQAGIDFNPLYTITS